MKQTLVYTKRGNDLMQAKRRSLHTKKKEKEEGEEFSIAGAGLFQIFKTWGYPMYDNVKRVGLEIWVIVVASGRGPALFCDEFDLIGGVWYHTINCRF